MIATKTLLLLACLVVGGRAGNLNTMIILANKTPVPLIAVGEGDTKYMYPGQELTFGGRGESARMYLYRWCPGAGDTGGPNSQVCGCDAANCLHTPPQVLEVYAYNPWIGVPRMQVWGAGATIGEKGYSEGQGYDCSASGNGFSYKAHCMREGDQGNKMMKVTLLSAIAGCLDNPPWQGYPKCIDNASIKKACTL